MRCKGFPVVRDFFLILDHVLYPRPTYQGDVIVLALAFHDILVAGEKGVMLFLSFLGGEIVRVCTLVVAVLPVRILVCFQTGLMFVGCFNLTTVHVTY